MVNIAAVQQSSHGCPREVAKHEKSVMLIVKNRLRQLKRLSKLFLSTNIKTFANYRIITKYNLLASEAYDFKRRYLSSAFTHLQVVNE